MTWEGYGELMQSAQTHASKTFYPNCTCTYISCPDFPHRKALSDSHGRRRRVQITCWLQFQCSFATHEISLAHSKNRLLDQMSEMLMYVIQVIFQPISFQKELSFVSGSLGVNKEISIHQ